MSLVRSLIITKSMAWMRVPQEEELDGIERSFTVMAEEQRQQRMDRSIDRSHVDVAQLLSCSLACACVSIHKRIYSPFTPTYTHTNAIWLQVTVSRVVPRDAIHFGEILPCACSSIIEPTSFTSVSTTLRTTSSVSITLRRFVYR